MAEVQWRRVSQRLFVSEPAGFGGHKRSIGEPFKSGRRVFVIVVRYGGPRHVNGVVMTIPASEATTVFTWRYGFIVLVQATYALSWSVFLLMPKFMTESLNATPDEIGAMGALTNLAAVASIPMLGWALDRWGRRPLATAGAILCGVQALWLATVHEIGFSLYATQMMCGLSFITMYNAGGALVVDTAPPARLGQALGIFGAANVLMNSISSLATEAIVARFDWSLAFLLAGLVAFVAAVMTLWLPETISPRSSSENESREPFRFDGSLARVAGASLGMGTAFSAVILFFQPFVLKQGVDDVSPFFLGFTGAVIIARTVFGQLADRWGRRRMATWLLLAYGAVVHGFPYLTDSRLMIFGAMFGVCHGLLHPSMPSLAVEGRPGHHRGSALAYVNGAFMLGNSIGAFGLGRLAVWSSYATVFMVGGTAAWIGLLLLQSQWLTARYRSSSPRV